MKKIVLPIALVLVLFVMAVHLFHRPPMPNLTQLQLQQTYSVKPIASVDHTRFEELQKEFATPQEVTEACIACHNERHKEVMASNHWNWERISYVEGRGIERMGKQNVLNNFCIGTNSNQQSCARCHIGFGMSNNRFDFENARNVDCMVCHDHSEEYIKGASTAGYPDRSVNLSRVAQSVGRPGNINCGACHFYGGGGNNVKHGDLEDALLTADRSVDVHMAANGINMTCVDCHTAENHRMKGTLYSVSSTHVNRLSCEECHTTTPHNDRMLDVHTGRIACQTCHIPTYAKENPTKMAWRWSEAGQLKDGQPFSEVDSMGREIYLSIKGSFEWATHVEPEYYWFNGHATHYILGDKVDSIPLQVNRLLGIARDRESKIIPVKVHRGDQIYDPNTEMLIQPKLWSEAKGDSAFWQDLDWDAAAAAGMQEAGLPYSGEYSFIPTEMYWPVNHMVAPKGESLTCAECHTREGGRLAGLNDFYLPGRDKHAGIHVLGRLLLLGAILGVLVHALLRFVSALRNNKMKSEDIQ
ncbi:tetrathionate reductase family octaheme c-type cytochrome [Geofilum rhodophaeum]|uniref:tetrathionate reductase family octaheme c-type cytochrome n=1 Tax=Geofilum rhodophaeum TaxID=1965019 RepID=UPI000B521DB4|nr:tetrathionate reductase family octaheme c-type cytochrome [Geofilum rhodophaeum]